MRNARAEAFNRKAASKKSRPDEIIGSLGLKRGQRVADIGAGGGYFSLRFAEIVGAKGRVYAVDTNGDFLEFIRDAAGEKGIGNLETVLAEGSEPRLPKRGLDLIFLRNVTHHIKNREEYFRGFRRFLKPGGKVAIIEYGAGISLTFHGLFGHKVPKETIRREMRAAGYSLENDLNFLSGQHFTIWR
ncbi:MAG: methyltransferase domain-containing protein [archaeon]